METRAVAHLSKLDIEIPHRRLPGEVAAQLISLRGQPSLEAFARRLDDLATLAPWLAAARGRQP